MKNFTNNFKLFTSRLSARWLIMALMLLVGTSSAWGADCASAYIKTWDGSKNTEVKLYDGCSLLNGINTWYSEGISYEISGSTFGIDFFVMSYHDNDQEYTNGIVYYSIDGGSTQPGTLTRDGDYGGKKKYKFYLNVAETNATKLDVWITVPHSDNNWKLDNDKQFTFKFTRPTTGEDCTTDDTKIRVEFKNPSGWTPYIWAWVEGGSNFTEGKWPGMPMNYDSVTGYHYFVINRGNTNTNQTVNVIFSNKGSDQKSTISGLKWSKVYKYDSNATKEDEYCHPPACSAPTSVSISRGNPTSGNICEDSTIDLTATVDGSGDITYVWEKTSGGNDWTIANASAQKCTVTAGTGSATFKITATRCGTDITKTITLTADAKPAITFASPSSICTGTEIDLTEDYVTSKTGTVTWYSDANRSQEITNGIVTPINTGTSQTTNTYFAKVTNGVCSAKTDVSLSIKVDPQSAITLKAAPTICNGTTVTFANYVNTSTGTVTWHTKSDFSDAAITSAKPSQTTTYYAKAKSGNCALATASLKVTVDPTPAITLNAAPTICPGDEVTFANYVKNTSIGTVTWHTDPNCNTAAITSATPNTTTIYYAKATSGVCDPATASLKVTVKPTPTKPAITLTPADGKIVAGEKATLTVTEQNDVTFTLYKDGASTGKTGNSFTIEEEGTYHVVGINSCKVASESDKKTITICTPNATLLSATYNQGTDKIDLRGNLTETCDKDLYYGFLWKVKGENWNTNNAISGTGDPFNVTSTNNTGFEQSWDKAVVGTTYVFTAYALDASSGNPSTYVWYYDETGIEASKCINIETPNIDPVAICSGSAATLTLKNKQNGVTYTLDDAPIFTVGNEYTTPTLNTNTNTIYTYTITATSTNSCVADQEVTATVTVTVNAMPTLSSSSYVTSICEGEEEAIRITTDATSIEWYKNETLIEGQTTASLSITTAGTYKVVVSNASGCSKEMSFTVANAFGSDITPTITGSASVQSGSTGINYSTANVDGATYEWLLPEGWTFSGDKDGNQITVSVPDTDGDGTITVRITKNSCTKTATLDVAWMDGFTVYLRRPHAKNETTQYNYWFEKSTAAGPGYIKFGTVKASPSDSELYTYNGGSGAETPGVLGTKGTESFTDCDGYVWDAYNIGIDVTALYFHAPNDKSTNGSTYGGNATYTRSYSQNTPISSDLYFTMGNWTSGKGRTLTKVEKPFEGIEIDALGSTEICNNNMASFAALYLKSNCTGQDITAYAWKFSENNSSWDDYATGKGATSNNIRPNVKGYYRLECTLEDGSVVKSNSIEIKTKTCTITNTTLNNITSNLPIIMVNTGNNNNKFPSVSNGKHCSASADDLKKKRSVDVKIIWNPSGTVSSTDAYSNGANLYYDRKARMNYRGSSSLNFEKKSFAFCPGDEMCGDDEKSADYVKTKKMNMFGIGEAEDKDWVLYAAYVDPSMMRNILAMETYSAMTGKWGVKNQYVELYIDGEYQGVYVFMDKVTQNKKRVNVKWDVKDDTKRDFILKFDKTDAADRYEDASGDQKTFESDMTGKTGISTYDTTVDQRFEIEYPEKEDIMDDGGYWSDVYSFVLGKVNEFESALSKGDFTKVRDLINYESWADFFILNEFTKNVDAYRASCIFVYTGGKFEAWPLWDYELSFNNTVTGSGKGRGDINGLLIEHSDVYSDEFPAPFWWTGKYNGSNMYSGLLKDPCFLQKIKERWAEHTKAGGPLNPSTTTAKTAAYKAILDANGAATREFKKWPVTSRGKDACSQKNTGYYSYGGGGATDYATSYNQLNEWLAGDADTDPRIKGLQKEIDKFDDVIKFGISSTIDKEETTPWRAVNVTVDAVGADFTYTITPEITKGQVIQGSDNLLIYAEPATLPQTYTVVTTLNAKDQCGGKDADNASSRVTFTVNDLVENCEE